MATIEMVVIIRLHFDSHRKKMTVILLTKMPLLTTTTNTNTNSITTTSSAIRYNYNGITTL